MTLTDDQRSEIFLWDHHSKSIEELFSMVGEWLEEADEAARTEHCEDCHGDGYDHGREAAEEAKRDDDWRRRILHRFEYRQQGIWHMVYDAERQEFLPGIYMPDQAKNLADDLNRRWRDN